MFIRKDRDIQSLDEDQLRGRAIRMELKIAGKLRRLQVTTLVGMGGGMLVMASMLIAPASLLLVGPVAAGAVASAFLYHVQHDRECRAEAERLIKEADGREEQRTLAMRAAEEATRAMEALAEKSVVLEAPTVVKAPLRLKKTPSPAPV